MRHMLSATPTTYSEIKSYLEMTGQALYPWEVNALKALDTTYIALLMEMNRNGNSQ